MVVFLDPGSKGRDDLAVNKIWELTYLAASKIMEWVMPQPYFCLGFCRGSESWKLVTY